MSEPAVESFVELQAGSYSSAFRSRVVIEQSTHSKIEGPSLLVLPEHLAGHTSKFQNIERSIRGTHVDLIEDVVLIGFEGMIKNQNYYCRKSQFGERFLKSAADAFGTYENKDTEIQPLGNDSYGIPSRKLSNLQELRESVFLGTLDEPDNWGIWLLYGIPALRQFITDRDPGRKLLCRIAAPWQRSMLEFCGVSLNDVIEHDTKASFRCADLKIRRTTWRDLFITDADRQALGYATEKAATFSQVPSGERIFISRGNNPKRKMVNEEELFVSLASIGFQLVQPELFTIDQQINIFQNAKMVVGLGGAGMFNTIFCKPGTTVLDIESGVFFPQYHLEFMASAKLNYGILIGDKLPGEPDSQHPQWKVDVGTVLDAIRRLV